MAESGKNERVAGMNVDTSLVRELAELLTETGLTEIEVEDGDRKIKVSRGMAFQPGMNVAVPAAPLAAPGVAGDAAPAAAGPAGEAAGADLSHAVRSPMVGTAYLHPEPGAAPFIKVGDKVKAGDTLLIVEAMKVMNPIVSTAAGTIQQILIENAQPVEFDQPLVVVG
jgi:acetyl-CoA carboxylase biotin carboxyl carrier protein